MERTQHVQAPQGELEENYAPVCALFFSLFFSVFLSVFLSVYWYELYIYYNCFLFFFELVGWKGAIWNFVVRIMFCIACSLLNGAECKAWINLCVFYGCVYFGRVSLSTI